MRKIPQSKFLCLSKCKCAKILWSLLNFRSMNNVSFRSKTSLFTPWKKLQNQGKGNAPHLVLNNNSEVLLLGWVVDEGAAGQVGVLVLQLTVQSYGNNI